MPRTSNLYAPIMLLEGHQGEIFASKFHPEGKHLASAGFDRQICKYSKVVFKIVRINVNFKNLCNYNLFSSFYIFQFYGMCMDSVKM